MLPGGLPRANSPFCLAMEVIQLDTEAQRYKTREIVS